MIPVDPSTMSGLPAPLWFILFFKIVGFFLHLIPMGLWFAGLPIAAYAAARQGEQGRLWTRRFLKQLPVILALGINFGIVPLLFLQVAYYKAFYTATILMAWHWLFVVGFVMVAYYGVYWMAFRSDRLVSGSDCERKAIIRQAIAFSLVLAFVGTIMTMGLTLTASPERWDALLNETNVAGAVSGWGADWGNPSIWARLLVTFGLGVVTTSAWIVCDAAWLRGKKSEEEDAAYKSWAQNFAGRTALFLGAPLVVLGTVFFWAVQHPDLRSQIMSAWIVLPILALAALIGSAVWLFLNRDAKPSGKIALIAAGLQVAALLLHAVNRQLTQHLDIGRWFKVGAIPEDVQWSPIVAFLLCFVFGLTVIGWMIAQLQHAKPSESTSE